MSLIVLILTIAMTIDTDLANIAASVYSNNGIITILRIIILPTVTSTSFRSAMKSSDCQRHFRGS